MITETAAGQRMELRIQRIFVDQLALRVDLEADVIDSGILDSLALVQLLAALEHEFGVTVNVATLELDDFRTITRIAQYVAAIPNGST